MVWEARGPIWMHQNLSPNHDRIILKTVKGLLDRKYCCSVTDETTSTGKRGLSWSLMTPCSGQGWVGMSWSPFSAFSGILHYLLFEKSLAINPDGYYPKWTHFSDKYPSYCDKVVKRSKPLPWFFFFKFWRSPLIILLRHGCKRFVFILCSVALHGWNTVQWSRGLKHFSCLKNWVFIIQVCTNLNCVRKAFWKQIFCTSSAYQSEFAISIFRSCEKDLRIMTWTLLSKYFTQLWGYTVLAKRL